MTVRESVLAAGRRQFGAGWTPSQWIEAPGRLELLGNHVDYNGGLVLAGAIDRTVMLGLATAPDSPDLAIAPATHGVFESFDPETLGDWRKERGEATTADYVRGIVASLRARGIPMRTGLQLAITGDVPVGFGMSSSAALCVASVLALSIERPTDRDIVLIAQEAEHRAGSPVGAMDQSASVAGDIILFDGASVGWTALHPQLEGYVFSVAHSGVSHALSTSSYPIRVQESRAALGIIQERLDESIASLSDVSLDQLNEIEAADWLDETLKKRVRHVATERQRVEAGVEAVRRNDWHAFGALMNASGRSSATDYDISHPVVEELVAEMQGMPGVLGARMMGGGEGGPALALIEADRVEEVRQALEDGFYRRHPVDEPGGAFQVCAFGPGARILDQ